MSVYAEILPQINLLIYYIKCTFLRGLSQLAHDQKRQNIRATSKLPFGSNPPILTPSTDLTLPPQPPRTSGVIGFGTPFQISTHATNARHRATYARARAKLKKIPIAKCGKVLVRQL